MPPKGGKASSTAPPRRKAARAPEESLPAASAGDDRDDEQCNDHEGPEANVGTKRRYCYDILQDDGSVPAMAECVKSHDTAKRCRRVIACMICGVKPTEAKWARKDKTGHLGPGCMACFETWVIGNFRVRAPEQATFDDFCIWLAEQAQDAEKLVFMTATKIRLGEVPKNFFPSEVFRAFVGGYSVHREYLGMTRGEFIKRFNVSPEELGYKQHDLINEMGEKYRGVLIINPDQPNLVYRMHYDVYGQHTAYKLPTDRMLRSEQAQEVFDSMSSQSSKTGLMQRLKLCTLTVEAVHAAVEAHEAREKEIEAATAAAAAAEVAKAAGEESEAEEVDPNAPVALEDHDMVHDGARPKRHTKKTPQLHLSGSSMWHRSASMRTDGPGAESVVGSSDIGRWESASTVGEDLAMPDGMSPRGTSEAPTGTPRKADERSITNDHILKLSLHMAMDGAKLGMRRSGEGFDTQLD